ncbi:hypothetical protein [Bacteriovorax sp. Seq25_V]|uniref:hypothetical protein n=1 Tax=Bacteriovorax sp. Seq25_V TaxID=1201288 RepID=UPI0018DFC9DB|nr:hypothetical protein [Bacteriovorax sp. Seq25_V]
MACDFEIDNFSISSDFQIPPNQRICEFIKERVSKIVTALSYTNKTQQQNQELYRNSEIGLSIQVQQIRIDGEVSGQIYINSFKN